MRFSKATLFKVLMFSGVCLAATVVLGLRLANYELFGGYKTYHAVFADATGVHQGDSVKVAGVSVGRVDGAEIRDGKAYLTFSLDQNVPITTSTTAILRWRNILGLRYLYLYPDPGGKTIEEGGTIAQSQTTDAADVGQFLNDLGPVLQAINPKAANEFIQAVDTALTGDEANVRGLIDSGSKLVTQLAQVDSQISQLIGSSDKVMYAFASQHKAIAHILDNLNSVGGVLQRTTGDVDHVMTDFGDVQGKLNYLLRSEKGNIDATLGHLDTVVETLAANKGNLERTLCTTPMGISNYFQTSSWGEWFNVRITTANVADSNGNILLRQPEIRQERGARATPALAGCPNARGAFYSNTGNPQHQEVLGQSPPQVNTGGSGLGQIVDMLTGGHDA